MLSLYPNSSPTRQRLVGPVDDGGDDLAVADDVGLGGVDVGPIGFHRQRLRVFRANQMLINVDQSFDRTLLAVVKIR